MFVVVMVTEFFHILSIKHMQKYKQKLLTLSFHLLDEFRKINANVNDIWMYEGSEGYNVWNGRVLLQM